MRTGPSSSSLVIHRPRELKLCFCKFPVVATNLLVRARRSRSQEKREYTVVLGDHPSCTCHEYEQSGYRCAHFFAAELHCQKGPNDAFEGAPIPTVPRPSTLITISYCAHRYH